MCLDSIRETRMPTRTFLHLTSVIENTIQGSFNLEFAKRGALRWSIWVYNAEANSTTPAFCKEQTDASILSSDRDSSVRGR